MDCIAVREKQKELHRLVVQHHEETARHKDNLADISKAKKDKPTAKARKKLQKLYETGIQNADKEAEVLSKALNNIKEIRAILSEKRLAAKRTSNTKGLTSKSDYLNMLTHRGSTLPVWIGKISDSPPPLCGAIPAESGYIAKVGDMVSALVKIENEDAWILAEVMKYDPNCKKYEVDDICEEQLCYTVPRRKVIPLPLMRPNPETHPQALFSKHELVLALFPQTSCFYRAYVKEPPSTLYSNYELLFEDNDVEGGFSSHSVCQQYVISYKEIK